MEELIDSLNQSRTVYVDVDGTLLLWPEPTPGVRKPGVQPTINRALVNILIDWKMYDHTREIIVWSGNGTEHARRSARYCGLFEHTMACIGKPQVMIDDSWKWFDNRVKFDQDFEMHEITVVVDGGPANRADKG